MGDKIGEKPEDAIWKKRGRWRIKSDLERFRGCLLGLAVGDAVGTTVEFKQRSSFQTVVDMVGGGPFHLQPGQWTDDTSMALCLATSLIAKKGFDPNDQMDKYWRWYKEGYLSSTGRCFDIGNTVGSALERYHRTENPFSGSDSPESAGNGSLMRLAPIPMFYFPDLQKIMHFAAESSRTTHGATECMEACQLFSEMLFNAFSGIDKEAVLFKTTFEPSMPKIRDIALGNYRDKRVDEIKGSGYVVESLEAALWCFYHIDSFEEAILQAANLGEDADTTAAICGQIAGAFHGETGTTEAVREEIPGARMVVERFHVAKHYRNAADQVRKQELLRLKKAMPKAEYQTLHGSFHALRKNAKDWNKEERKSLRRFFEHSPVAKQVYVLRERRTAIFEMNLSKKQAQSKFLGWIRPVPASGWHWFDDVLKLLATGWGEIFIRRENTGFVEGFHKQVKVLKRCCDGIFRLRRPAPVPAHLSRLAWLSLIRRYHHICLHHADPE